MYIEVYVVDDIDLDTTFAPYNLINVFSDLVAWLNITC